MRLMPWVRRAAGFVIAFATIHLPSPATAGIVFDLPAAIVPSTSDIGPSFVLPVALAPTDSLRAVISGTVDFNVGNSANYSADWNAAGVVVRSRSTRLTVGGTDLFYINAGWLRLTIGNESLGYFPLLELNSANGLGSSNPPEVLTLLRPLSAIITSPGFAGLPAGTTLRYRIVDSPRSDNAGAFVISTAAVPEPAGLALIGVGLLAVAIARAVGAGPGRRPAALADQGVST